MRNFVSPRDEGTDVDERLRGINLRDEGTNLDTRSRLMRTINQIRPSLDNLLDSRNRRRTLSPSNVESTIPQDTTQEEIPVDQRRITSRFYSDTTPIEEFRRAGFSELPAGARVVNNINKATFIQHIDGESNETYLNARNFRQPSYENPYELLFPKKTAYESN